MQVGPVRGYTSSQIILHWLIVVLVLFQLIFGESMSSVFRAAQRGTTPDPNDATLATLHIWVGFAILAAVVIRLALRLRQGPPPPPEGQSPVLEWIATATHWLFYFLLFAVPISGIVAYYWQPAAGEVHELGKPAFIILIVLHAGAALWHQFWLRDGLLMRMLKPGA